MIETSIGTGLVVGQFGIGVVDGPDLDQEPEIVPYDGWLEFIPSVPYLPVLSATPNSITVVLAPIRGVLDWEGYLCTPDTDGTTPMYRGLRLFGTDGPDVLVDGWTWKVVYHFTHGRGAVGIDSHSMAVPVGSEIDLTTVVKVPSSPGLGTEQAEALVVRAEAAAQVARRVQEDADAGAFDGPQGPQGPPGTPGTAVAKGDKGDKGDTGATGATGAKGDPGAVGAKGATGTTGTPGTPGTKGDKGDKGDTGATGATGAAGESSVTVPLPASEHNLNNYTTAGAFVQTSDSPATLARNYPAVTGGLLKVEASAADGTFIYQYYHTPGTGLASVNNQQMYMRLKKAGTWSPWKQLATV